ncbi:unnamed protein product [Ambrosiozyma monospora]|uniref:Unnamed protein product n=1 Tax=Ambrosiozyma monospora TaxID=43982 RepID=A0ACB5TRK2_AMBMO|nr:unnamed protein product [Ambrosiozyma monospora]
MISSSKGSWKAVGDAPTTNQQLPPAKPITSLESISQPSSKTTVSKPRIETQAKSNPENETVYRDSSGRKITDKERIERQPKTKEQLERERRQKLRELNESELDKKLKLDSKSESSSMKKKNEIPKSEQIDDDDPALLFSKNLQKEHRKRTGKYVSATGRKLYKGAFPENRFGVKPGHRWDGVDRSNGFEHRWFEKQINVRESKVLEYTLAEDE